ncbi:MAG: TetR/AcrR family transcriptional regulator [Clostridia bacterium]|nr:TetR/AcrR family transcriptional regulator [Clostridia bacterium]
MQKKNDINTLTKECIVTALLRLMQTKSYDSISITDITNLAGVSRMAYYRNYKSKDEILIKHLVDMEKSLLEEVGGEKAETFRGAIGYVSGFFQENADVIKAIYDAGLAHLLTKMLEERVYSYFPIAATAKEGRYAVHYYVGALLSVFKLWFDNGMKESVDEISDIIYNLINNESALKYIVMPIQEVAKMTE